MSVSVSAGTASAASTPSARPCPAQVRAATHDDLAAVAGAVEALLSELGGTPPSERALRETARALLEDPDAGALLVAQIDEEIVGVLGASWQLAMHAPGRYALIQDLWVHPAWRSRGTGRELVAALGELARTRGMTRVEVGLPRERFDGLRATEAFYLSAGFRELGSRMRWVLS